MTVSTTQTNKQTESDDTNNDGSAGWKRKTANGNYARFLESVDPETPIGELGDRWDEWRWRQGWGRFVTEREFEPLPKPTQQADLTGEPLDDGEDEQEVDIWPKTGICPFCGREYKDKGTKDGSDWYVHRQEPVNGVDLYPIDKCVEGADDNPQLFVDCKLSYWSLEGVA